MIALDLIFVKNSRSDGGERRIRTSVARKERQIYSLLPLTTRPSLQVLRRMASNRVPGAGEGT